MRSKLKEIWDLHVEDQKKEYDKIFAKDKNTITGALFLDEIVPNITGIKGLDFLNDPERAFNWLVPKNRSYNTTSLDVKSILEKIKGIYKTVLETFQKEGKMKGPKNIQKLNAIFKKYSDYQEKYYLEFIKKKDNYLKNLSESTYICYEVEKDGKIERKCENYAEMGGQSPETFLEGKNEKEFMFVCKNTYCESKSKKKQGKICCKKKNKTRTTQVSGGKKRKTLKKKY